MTQPLVLSLFPGIGLLDMAFELEGFCVVRGPDVLWGGDIRRFHPPAGVFDGVIGGPPCQSFSPLARLIHANGHEVRFGNLVPEYERVVSEAAPTWFVMENVPDAPLPVVDGYGVDARILDTRWIGEEQQRRRRFCFGTSDRRPLTIEVALFEAPLVAKSVTSNSGGRGKRHTFVVKRGAPTVTSSDGGGRGPKMQGWRYKLPDACRLQGLPEDFLDDAPFTADGKLKAVANGVPIPMGRAIARAVKRAMGYQESAA